jgi:hypothetical protein
MIIKELEEAAKTFVPSPHISKYTPDEDDTITRYLDKVPRDLLMKYIPGHKYQSIRDRSRILRGKRGKTAAVPAAKTPPTPKEVVAVSKKTAPAVKKPKPAKKRWNTNPNKWSDEEKDAIKDCPDQEAATKRYKKKFPDSTRNPYAVEQRWYILTKDKRKAIPKKKLTEAAALTGKKTRAAGPVKPGNLTSKKPRVEHERLPYKMKNKPSKVLLEVPTTTTEYPQETAHTAADEDPLDPSPPGTEEQEYRVKGLDEDLTNAMPHDRPPAKGKEQREARKISKGLTEGQKVRHNGSSSSPYFGKDGTIIDFDAKGQVLVDFGKGSTWLPPNVLLPYKMKVEQGTEA